MELANDCAQVHGGGFMQEDKMRMSKDTSDAFKWPSDLNWSPNVHVCLSKDAFFTPYGNGGENFPGLSGKALFYYVQIKIQIDQEVIDVIGYKVQTKN